MPLFRLSNEVVNGLEDTDVYVDDIIVYSNDWESHIIAITALFVRLAMYGLTVNLVKSDFGQATVSYLGHVVGCGQVAPLKAKGESISNFPTPTCKKSLMSFLGLAGFYRKFCRNFSDVALPLTNLLKKSEICMVGRMQQSFQSN